MRVLLLLCLLLTLISYCVAVPVIYTLCSKNPDINITSVDANEWPPKKGTSLETTITGINSKDITAGTYTESIKVAGFPLPPTKGDISEVKPLPWPKGDIDFVTSTDIPASSPSAKYEVTLSAVDQDKDEIFCVVMTFSLSEMQNIPTANRLQRVLNRQKRIMK